MDGGPRQPDEDNPNDLTDASLHTIAKALDRNGDLLKMSPSQLALYTEGHAEPGSMRDSFHRYIMDAKIAELQAATVSEQTEAQDRSSRATERLTAAYVRATWAIAALTGMLVVVMIVDTALRLAGR